MANLLLGLGALVLGVLIILAGEKILRHCLKRDEENGPDYGPGGLLLFTGIMFVLCGLVLAVFSGIWVGLHLVTLIITT